MLVQLCCSNTRAKTDAGIYNQRGTGHDGLPPRMNHLRHNSDNLEMAAQLPRSLYLG